MKADIEELKEEDIGFNHLTDETANEEVFDKDPQDKESKRSERICRSAFRSFTRSILSWIVLLIGTVVSFILFTPIKETSNSGSFGFIFCLSLMCVLCFFFISRIYTSVGQRKRIGIGGKGVVDGMPQHPTAYIKELYINLHCKRCINYWLTITVCTLGVISAIYCMIAFGIEKAVNGSNAQYQLLNPENYKGKKVDEILFGDWSKGIFYVSLMLSVFMYIRYIICTISEQRAIIAIENHYGKERLVDSCLVCSRVNEVNKRYKNVCFVIVCFVGCVIYIFFKRMICTLFEKSFSI